jgi:hypothetical protein
MAERPAAALAKTYYVEDITVAASPVSERPSNGRRSSGTFEAGLLYIAADLQDLAKQAPPDKVRSTLALVDLIRTLAEH